MYRVTTNKYVCDTIYTQTSYTYLLDLCHKLIESESHVAVMNNGQVLQQHRPWPRYRSTSFCDTICIIPDVVTGNVRMHVRPHQSYHNGNHEETRRVCQVALQPTPR